MERTGRVAGLYSRTLHVYEMDWGTYRTQHRSRRWRRLLMSSRRWALLLVLTAFIATNSLLYRGINRADGRSVDPRSLPVKERVISIDSWQAGEDGDARWDLYIDSPRHFRGLSGSQREKGDSGAEGNRAKAPVVRYIRRGEVTDKRRGSGVHADTEVVKGFIGEAVAKQVTVKLHYQAAVDQRPGGVRTKGNSGDNRHARPDEMTNGSRNLVNVQSPLNQSRLYLAPVKLKSVSKHVSRNSPQFNGQGHQNFKPSPENLAMGGVRFFSRPPWLSKHDVDVLRLLADDPISSFQTFSPQHAGKLGLGFLIYEPGIRTGANLYGDRGNSSTDALRRCRHSGVTCAVLFPPAEIHRVTAFHLDRVLGFNRTLPTVSRRLTEDLRRQVGLPVDVSFPLMLYDPGLYLDAELTKITRAQLSDCIGGTGGVEEQEWCNNVLTEDWGAVALFDFLLQIYHRLDFGCCGLEASARQRRCGMAVVGSSRAALRCPGGRAAANQQTIGCNYRLASSKDRLVLVENLVDLLAPTDALDLWLLRGPNSFPAHAVDLIREGRLRQMLLQSLFGDKGYWEGQGGRPAIEEILDVIEKRAKIFLRHIGS